MGRPPRILIADDNTGDRHLLRQAMRDIGWNAELEEAASGAQTITTLRRLAVAATPPDLVLLDFHLRDSTCISILEKLRGMSGYESLPVIIMSTALPREPDRQRCFALGVVKVLVKAADFTALVKTVSILKKILEGDGSISSGGSWVGNSDLASLPGQ